eukprot:3144452-Amphidinium_carterae.1
MPKAKGMANHNNGTILAKARRGKSPTLPTTPMPTVNNGIATMLGRINPTLGFLMVVNNGTTTTVNKVHDVIHNMPNNNNHSRSSTLACLVCLHMHHTASTMLRPDSGTRRSSSTHNRRDTSRTSGQ